MDSPEMVERVARAMAEAAGFAWEACAQSQWRRDARSGIAAMREPTEAMTAAAHKVWKDFEARRVALTGGSGDLAHPNWETHYFQAMIDAALDQPKPTFAEHTDSPISRSRQ